MLFYVTLLIKMDRKLALEKWHLFVLDLDLQEEPTKPFQQDVLLVLNLELPISEEELAIERFLIEDEINYFVCLSFYMEIVYL